MFWVAGLLAAASLGTTAELASDPASPQPPATVEFNKHIRPILSDTCFQCHGFEAAKRKANLRLDILEGATNVVQGRQAIKPGDLEASQLWKRVNATQADVKMPPPDSGKKLTAAQIAWLGAWIKQGAAYQPHWAFVPPRRPEPPAVRQTAWPRGDLDRFILARLESEQLSPTPEAPKPMLIRRVTLDLTGLPPTPEEVDAFLADRSAEAYERVVDRLLESPRYGEHMARYWLDAARYGDTHGLHLDNERSLWPYRDWVVAAFNRNQPFDQFTLEQLAGDLLPNPSREQLIASGFNRCNVTTSEGGAIAEEFQARYAVDRVETTSAVWLGLTMGCAACHDHKLDPITQKEFYQTFSIFNNIAESAMDGNALLPAPALALPSPEQEKKEAALKQSQTGLEKKLGEAAAKFNYTDPATVTNAPKPSPTEFVWIEDDFPPQAAPKVNDGNLPHKWITAAEGPVLSGKRAFQRAGRGIHQVFFDGNAYWDRAGQVSVNDPALDPLRSLLAWQKSEAKLGQESKAPDEIKAILKLDTAKRGQAQLEQLRHYYLGNICAEGPSLFGPIRQELKPIRESRQALEKEIPSTLIAKETAKPRPAWVLLRGQYDKHGEPVGAGVPSVLPPLPASEVTNRLAFARWLVSTNHPLTARVTVNRFWQQFLGTGLVKTTGDFGSKGEWPSHPELLDWLATEFMRSGWNVKQLVRLIVTSAAYRQDSRVTPKLLEVDPENRLLARGPRFRLDGEVLRDQALYVSGLLNLKMGGRGVRPYQPPGIWEAVGYTTSNTAKYQQDHGEALYRRSLYLFWKRTAPPPSMTTFDAPSREQCAVRRERTNTPLQALLLLNDPQYLEAARQLGYRIWREGGTNDAARLRYGFRLVTAREPECREGDILQQTLGAHRDQYRANPEAAKQVIAVGESPVPAEVAPAELAAYTMLANLLLNLDEVVTRN